MQLINPLTMAIHMTNRFQNWNIGLTWQKVNHFQLNYYNRGSYWFQNHKPIVKEGLIQVLFSNANNLLININ